MKPQDIKVGKTYRNRGKGRTTRTVLGIGYHVPPPPWLGKPENRPALQQECASYLPGGGKPHGVLTLKSFAAWAGGEVKP